MGSVTCAVWMISTTHRSFKALSLKMAPTVGTSGHNTHSKERGGEEEPLIAQMQLCVWSHTLKDLLQQLTFSSIGLCLYLCQYHTILMAVTL